MSELQELIANHKEAQARAIPDERRVVCAANRWSDGTIIMGVRHYCPLMLLNMHYAGLSGRYDDVEQGFIDQWGNFLTQEEAYVIAKRQGQYRPWEPYTPGVLFSEDLY